jgi:hypothetical protein
LKSKVENKTLFDPEERERKKRGKNWFVAKQDTAWQLEFQQQGNFYLRERSIQMTN